MNTKYITLSALAATLFLTGCDTSPEGTLVARAADYELTVGETVSLLAGQDLPNQEDVVRAVAELWVDYTLLAEAASTDTTLQHVDLTPLVRPQLEQEMILMLRDSLVEPDTAVTEAELERLFDQEQPGVRVRPRHILLTFPQQATEAQRDSVLARLREIRARIVAGEDFADLAREYSQDPGSASRGGDMGFMARGEMVPSLEQVAFSLEPGELSEPVGSPYGLHLIQMQDRQTTTFPEARERFRRTVQQRRSRAAEAAFVERIEEEAEPEIQEGAVELVREVAEQPRMRLSGRAARRPLVEYDGGELTLGEVRDFLRTRPAEYRGQVTGASDQVVEESVLMALTQKELLVREARERGIEPPEAARDSLTRVARQRFRAAARELNLLHVEPDTDQTLSQAVERRVQILLQGILAGARNVIPLGAISYTLRQDYDARVFPGGIDLVMERIEEIRGPDVDVGASGRPTGEAPAAPTGSP